jgi:hypothetical protein
VPRRLAATLLTGLALAGSGAPGVAAMKEQVPRRSTDQPRPRDGNIAIREELDAARRAGTLEAYDLFIARHPRHSLAAVARRERAALAAGKPDR